VGAAGFLWSGLAAAQEPEWRHDYNAARREAREKNRPLVLDFGTAHCFWCKKLDGSTFRDPEVVKFLNECFVPLKIDADKDAPLAKMLGITNFPTLLFAAPDGKILGIHEGFVETAPFTQKLRRALAESTQPGGRHDPGRPAAGDKPGSAVSAPSPAIIRATAPEETGPAVDRVRRAREQLALAADDYRSRHYVCCLERCKALAEAYPDLPEGTEALRLAARIKGDPESARQACEGLSDRLGELYLELAEGCLRQNQRQQAAICLERVLQVSPGSRLGQAARERLARLNERPAEAAPNGRPQAP
jgi:hypothetical protein